jgi:hypothetical protein
MGLECKNAWEVKDNNKITLMPQTNSMSDLFLYILDRGNSLRFKVRNSRRETAMMGCQLPTFSKDLLFSAFVKKNNEPASGCPEVLVCGLEHSSLFWNF